MTTTTDGQADDSCACKIQKTYIMIIAVTRQKFLKIYTQSATKNIN